MPVNYRDDLLELCERLLGSDPMLKTGKMMGHPGYKIADNNKFFLFLYEDGITLKLPPDMYEKTLKRDDMEPFAPMGEKPMSTWVVWTLPDAEDYHADWDTFVGSAIGLVAQEPPNPKKKR